MFRIDRNQVAYVQRSESREGLYTQVGAELEAARKILEEDMLRFEDERRELSAQTKAEAEEILKNAREQARAEAEEIVVNAKVDAGVMLQQAKIEGERIKSEAWNEGFADGKIAAEKEVNTEFERRAKDESERFEALLADVAGAKDRIIAGLEKEIVELVLETVKKVTFTQIDESEEAFPNIVKNALSQMKNEGKITIKVSQAEYDRFFPDGSASFVVNGERINATVVSDVYSEKGDCIAESEGEYINAGVNAQLRSIEIAFKRDESMIG